MGGKNSRYACSYLNVFSQLLRHDASDYREQVFAYVDKEDSPRSLSFQLDLLRATGFSHYDVLHRTSVFACYVAVR